MVVGVAVFEIHIPNAQSLKEKRMVVKSLRDRIRNRFEISAAEVALQDLHQRSRIAVSVVSSDEKTIDRILEELVGFIEQEASLLGWNHEIIHFDEETGLQMPHMKFGE